MGTASLAVALGALVLALIASQQAKAAMRAQEESNPDLRRQIRNLEQEIERNHNVQQELLARVATGEKVTRSMVMDGQLFRDIDASEAKQLILGGDVQLIDIRTPHETAAGFIPGAQLIPMDSLEDQLDQIPKRGTKIIYCAAGMRSASICDALAARGYEDLLNLEGGIGAWTGELEKN